MLIDLSGKTAIVTGAGRGIGRVIARTLAAEGVKVAIVDIRPDFLADAKAEWAKAGHEGLFIETDVRDKSAVARAVGEVERAWGRIDILVNNAGVATGARIEALEEQVWDDNFDTNTKGSFLMAQAVAPIMKRQKAGRIINAASFAIIIPSIGSAAYAASKAAVVSFTRVLAGELGPFNVTVNCYSPGMIPTEMNGYAKMPEARQNRLLDTLTLRRWGEPEDVAKLICFLASDLSAYITGAMIDVSGGKFATQIPAVAYE